jgi:hypothetical protein
MNHPINDPFEYWRVLLYLVFLDHLVTEISSRVIKKEARFSGACLVPWTKLPDVCHYEGKKNQLG